MISFRIFENIVAWCVCDICVLEESVLITSGWFKCGLNGESSSLEPSEAGVSRPRLVCCSVMVSISSESTSLETTS